MKYMVFILIFFSNLSQSDNYLKKEYSKILNSECQIESKDERDLIWGCIVEKTDSINKFKAVLDGLISEIITNNKGDVKIQSNELKERLMYDLKLDDLIDELYFTGTDATTASLKVKQYIAKQQVELYLHILLDYYVFEETKN